jgi:peptidyl-prolyl cis-trans isomerase SurA
MILRPSQFRAVWVVTAAFIALPAFSSSQTTKPAPTNPPAQQSPYAGTVVEDIIAYVNDQIISRSDYERADQQLEAEAKQQNVSPADLEAHRKALLRDLIDTQLLLSKGKELGITGETELVRRLDEIRKQNHLDSMEALEKAATDQGVSFEDFKANIRNNIITQSVIREEVGRKIQMTPSEIQRFYQAHKADFDQPEQVRLSELLVPTASSAPQIDKSAPLEVDPAKLAEAKAAADDAYAKLKAGAKFEELSKTISSAPTAQEGGDLGTFKRGMLAKELEDKTFALKEGQFTEPIRTKQGYIILKVIEHVLPGAAQYKQIQPQVEEAAYMERMQPAMRQYLTTLREQAAIDVKPGFVDVGASPKQTKFVFSAYNPPAPKKKKVTRTRYRQTSFRSKSRTTTPDAALPPAGTAPTVATSDGSAKTTTTASASQPPAAPSVSMKPGKKEKIRFGQAPRETLPASAKTEHEDAGAGSATTVAEASQPLGTEVASVNEPPNPLEQTAKKGDKKRFSDRLKLPKEKKTAPKADPFAPPPVTTDEAATQKTQAAPLGLGGDTAHPKKVKKTKEEKGEKRRLQDEEKKGDKPAASPAPATTPSATPPETTPAPTAQP